MADEWHCFPVSSLWSSSWFFCWNRSLIFSFCCSLKKRKKSEPREDEGVNYNRLNNYINLWKHVKKCAGSCPTAGHSINPTVKQQGPQTAFLLLPFFYLVCLSRWPECHLYLFSTEKINTTNSWNCASHCIFYNTVHQMCNTMSKYCQNRPNLKSQGKAILQGPSPRRVCIKLLSACKHGNK